jgi:crossover junction endodeoxyribonuclease RusA
VIATTNDNPYPIDVIQAATPLGADDALRPPIPLERTSDTGLSHVAGAVSMARDGPDTATTSFFVVTQDTPSLDYGGGRNPDGQGFAVFGQVVVGLDVARAIQARPTDGRDQRRRHADARACVLRRMTTGWTGTGKVRAREIGEVVEITIDGLTTQAKYYKPLVYEFMRKEWASRPAWGDYVVEIVMEHVGDPPWMDLDNLAKALLDSIKGYLFHDDSQVARLLVERREGERERITIRVFPRRS